MRQWRNRENDIIKRCQIFDVLDTCFAATSKFLAMLFCVLVMITGDPEALNVIAFMLFPCYIETDGLETIIISYRYQYA